MGKKFDITAAFGAVMQDVSNLDTNSGREQIEYIDIDQIDSDAGNFYSMDGLQELASTIQLCGLQQPIRVRENESGRLTIISGHRRRAAIQILVDDGLDQFRSVPCIREREGESDTLKRLKLIIGNSETRNLTPAEQSKQAVEIETLLYLLKEEGVEFPGRMRDQVAAACNVSAPKLARLKVIRDKLISDYMCLFDEDKLPEQTAYALARMPVEFQRRLAAVLSDPPTGARAEDLLKKYADGWRWEPTMECPDGKPCKRGDTFLRHDSECWSGEMCGGHVCCLSCDKAKNSYSPCERMCSKAKALRKEKRDEVAEAAEEKKRLQQQKLQKEIQKSAQRLLVAVDAAGLADDVSFTPQAYRGALSIADLRSYASGEFGEKYFYSNDLSPERMSNVAEIAKLFCCSADYILGLTDELTVVSQENQPTPKIDDGDRQPVKQLKQGKRLTRRNPDGTTYYPACLCDDAPCGGGMPSDECINCLHNEEQSDRLAAYEDILYDADGNEVVSIARLRELVSAAGECSPWCYTDPTEDGFYWCLVGPMRGGGKLMYWHQDHWEFAEHKINIYTSAVCWMRCPEIPEAQSWQRVEV